MIIDVVINSCARPDLLEQSILSFRDKVKTYKHKFRYKIVEDYVEDSKRRYLGRKWIIDNYDLFDEVTFLNSKAGFGYHWQQAVKLVNTDYHIHLEDDQLFILDVNVDPLIDVLVNNSDNFLEIVLRRSINQNRPESNPREYKLNNVTLIETDFMSDSIGIYNTKLVNKLLDYVGRENQLHEAKVLTPATKKLGLRKFVLGPKDEVHYTHVGQKKEYRHGGWVYNG